LASDASIVLASVKTAHHAGGMDLPKRGNVLATLLFTDIVGSTALAEQLGDRRWREVLARHHATVRQHLKRFGGRELDTSGDGFFAAFPKPADAIRCACEIVEEVQRLGIDIRAGLHMGEAESFGGKLSGVTVHLAARTLGAAGPAQVMVTGALKDMVPGSGFRFRDRGLHELKGIPGEWRLFEVTEIDGRPQPTPLLPEVAATRLEGVRPAALSGWARASIAGPAAAAVIAVVISLVAFLGSGDSAPGAGGSGSPAPPVTETGEIIRVNGLTDEPPTRLASLAEPPSDLAFGEGSIWVTLPDAGVVLRLDPESGAEQARIDVGSQPMAVAVGARSVWVACAGDGRLVPVDPSTNKVQSAVELTRGIDRIAIGQHAVWVGNVHEETLARIDPVTHQLLSIRPVAHLSDIAAEEQGLWIVTYRIESGPVIDLAWVDDRSNQKEWAENVVNSSGGGSGLPAAVIASGDQVWVTAAVDSTVRPYENRAAKGPIQTGRSPVALAVDPRGNLWVANRDDDTLWKFSPSGKTLGVVRLEGAPISVIASEFVVWVTVTTTDTQEAESSG
jgi:class 3 adenylate cyclase/streptogramin lyase